MWIWPGFETLVWNYTAVALNGCVKGALCVLSCPCGHFQLNKGFLSMSFTHTDSFESRRATSRLPWDKLFTLWLCESVFSALGL